MALGECLALILALDEYGELCKKIAEARKELKFLEAQLRVERTSKFEDSSISTKGRLLWRADAVYSEESEPLVRTLVKGGEATVLQSKPRRADIYPLDRYFFPATLLVLHEDLRKEWDVAILARPDETKLPSELHVKDGDKPKPLDAKLPGNRPKGNVSPIEGEEGRYLIVELKPKSEALREYLTSVRLFLHKETLHVEKMIVDDSASYAVYRFSEWKKLDEVEERRFELDLNGVKTERK